MRPALPPALRPACPPLTCALLPRSSIGLVVVGVLVGIVSLAADDDEPPVPPAGPGGASSAAPGMGGMLPVSSDGGQCPEGVWFERLFDDNSFSVAAGLPRCSEQVSTRDGFLSTCGNYKNNGCWGEHHSVAAGCPRELSDCRDFSAHWSTTLTLTGGAEDYRFFTSMDDRAEIWIDGALAFTTVCEWGEGSCAQQTFDRSLAAGPHTIAVRYVQTVDGAYADLHWVALGPPCPAEQWRLELYSNVDFSSDHGLELPPTCARPTLPSIFIPSTLSPPVLFNPLTTRAVGGCRRADGTELAR